MEEEQYPVDARGRPDLSCYTRPASYYRAMHARGIQAGGSFSERVHGAWGLIAKGAEGVPHALELLQSRNATAREDGAGMLQALGKADGVVEALLSALSAETDRTAKDGLIQALGGMLHRTAVPALAAIITNDAEDGDTRHIAAASLGRIVRRRFDKQADPIAAAQVWIATQGKRSPQRG